MAWQHRSDHRRRFWYVLNVEVSRARPIACTHVISENSGGGTSGFMMRVHLRMLQSGMIANNIKSQDIVSFSPFAEFRLHHLSFQISYFFKDQVLVQF